MFRTSPQPIEKMFLNGSTSCRIFLQAIFALFWSSNRQHGQNPAKKVHAMDKAIRIPHFIAQFFDFEICSLMNVGNACTYRDLKYNIFVELRITGCCVVY